MPHWICLMYRGMHCAAWLRCRSDKPTARIVIVDYLAKQGPHRDDPLLQVGKEEATKLLAAIGFKPVDDVALFPDKYFVVFAR